jgi:hypothetical protein
VEAGPGPQHRDLAPAPATHQWAGTPRGPAVHLHNNSSVNLAINKLLRWILVTNRKVEILSISVAVPDPGSGSAMNFFRIRDEFSQDP